jgi:hypothetical protein
LGGSGFQGLELLGGYAFRVLRFRAVRGLGFKGLRQRTASRAPPRRVGLPRVRGSEFGDHDIGLGTLGLGFGVWGLTFGV